MDYKVFIIGIELNSLLTKNKFENFLGSQGEWKKISDGCYLVKPTFITQSSMELKNRISPFYNGGGQLFVMKTSFDASWEVKGEISSWLSNNL